MHINISIDYIRMSIHMEEDALEMIDPVHTYASIPNPYMYMMHINIHI